MKKTAAILIVEEDTWQAEQHERVLNRAGYNTAVALHALAAIEAIDDIHPDVIVLDVLLIGNTAFTLLHELQTYSDTGNIPVIMCTNIASDLSIDDLKPYGVRLVLDKTKMAPKDLVSAVQSVLV